MWHAMHLPYGLPYAASQTHPEPSKRLLEAAMWRSGIGPRDQAAAPLSGRPRSTCMCGISHRGGGQPRCCLATWPRVLRCHAPQPRRPAAAPHLISAAPQRSCRNDFACQLRKIARDGGGGDGAARELCLASSLVRKPSRMLPRCGQFNVGLLLQFGDFRRQVELGPSAHRRGAFGRRVLLSRVCTSETHGPACASHAHVLVLACACFACVCFACMWARGGRRASVRSVVVRVSARCLAASPAAHADALASFVAVQSCTWDVLWAGGKLACPMPSRSFCCFLLFFLSFFSRFLLFFLSFFSPFDFLRLCLLLVLSESLADLLLERFRALSFFPIFPVLTGASADSPSSVGTPAIGSSISFSFCVRARA